MARDTHYYEENQEEILINISSEKREAIEDLAFQLKIDLLEDLISFLVTGDLPSKDIAKAIPVLDFPQEFYRFLFSPSITGIAVSEKIRFADEQKLQYEKYLFCVEILSRIFGVKLRKEEVAEEGIAVFLEWNKIEKEEDLCLLDASVESLKEEDVIEVDLEHLKKEEEKSIAVARIMNSRDGWKKLQELRQEGII